MSSEVEDLKAENQQLKDTIKGLVKENNRFRRAVMIPLLVLVSFVSGGLIGYLISIIVK